MNYYSRMSNIIYDRWEKDDCDGIIEEILCYKILDEAMRDIFELKDEEITKDMILNVIRAQTKDKGLIDEARELSDCFEEKI